MQRSHSPTTWRHPKENDTMGSTYSCGNLAPWQVWGGRWVAIAEIGHLTLWLAMSGCQVGEGEKKKETVGFSFPEVRIQSTCSIFVLHILTYSAWQIKWGYYGYYHKKKTVKPK